MLRNHVLCSFVLACACFGTASTQGAVIFPDGFETGVTCAWSVTVGGDFCSRLFAHSGQNLYRIDTSTLDVILVGHTSVSSPRPESGTSSRALGCTAKSQNGTCNVNECKQRPGGATFDHASLAAAFVDAGYHGFGTGEGGNCPPVL